jgi:hypothetical protein
MVLKPDVGNKGLKHQQYGLSGIEICKDRRVFKVPGDKNLALFGEQVPEEDPWTKLHIDVFASGLRRAHEYPYGYPIHARCWDLIERVFGGREVVENHLGCLLHALQQRWTEEVEAVRWQFDWLLLVDEDERQSPFTENRVQIAFHDPMKIPALHDLIEKSSRRRERFRRTRARRMVFLDVGYERFGLLTEIKWLIVDCLDYKTIPHALRAFGWILPDSYWYQRLSGLIFEVEDVKFENVDWQFLCLEVEKFLEFSPELKNRQRVMRLLQKAKNIFLEQVEQHGSPQFSFKS